MSKSDAQPCRGCGKPTYLTAYCSERCFNQQKQLARTECYGSEILPFIFLTASAVFLVLAAVSLLNL